MATSRRRSFPNRSKPSRSRRVSGGPSGEQLDESLDRFGEHLVRSLNQLFDEYVGEALGHMQAEHDRVTSSQTGGENGPQARHSYS